MKISKCIVCFWSRKPSKCDSTSLPLLNFKHFPSKLCDLLQYPRETVAATAVVFLKRYFLYSNDLDLFATPYTEKISLIKSFLSLSLSSSHSKTLLPLHTGASPWF